MPFTFFDLLTWTIVYLQFFIIAKIVIRDKTLHLKETVYAIAASLFLAVLFVTGITVFNIDGIISTAATPLVYVIYFYKIKAFALAKTIIFTLISIIIVGISDIAVMAIANLFFPSFLPSIPNFPLPIGFSFHLFLQFAPYILSAYIFSCLTTFLLVKMAKKPYDLINQNSKAQTALAVGSSFGVIISVIFVNIWRLYDTPYEFLFWNALALSIVFVVGLVSVMIYAKSWKEKLLLKQKETEQRVQREYMEYLEAQLTGMRKFKHDYKNILLSIDGFVHIKDWIGLEQYMPKVRSASGVIITDEFALENLSKIKLPEIKILLTQKLMIAQNISMDIHTTFEADHEIDTLPVDSVVLVRMLGIIMDNAVEELQKLGKGQFSIACFKVKNTVNFVVKNTCRPNLPSIRQLSQSGFSTKGANRGMGLSNLSELANSTPNVALQTDVVDGNFMQWLILGGGD